MEKLRLSDSSNQSLTDSLCVLGSVLPPPPSEAEDVVGWAKEKGGTAGLSAGRTRPERENLVQLGS